jgi:hypothetical protein
VVRRVATCAAIVAAALYAACLLPSRYPCDDDEQCEREGERGVCRDPGWCAYPDGECPSGLRYSKIADDQLASTCVPAQRNPTTTTGGGESSTSAGSTSATSEGSESSSSTGAPPCESICVPGPHVATAMCDPAGQCIITCDPPWQDCDGDVATGCEVPVGVAHQCDAQGLDSVEGCWTAYCGSSVSESAVNFGTYYCMDCITCQQPTEGQCRWCDHDTGHFFTPKGCSCGGDLGAVCAP